MGTPKDVFRDNLRRLAKSYRLDCDGLAAALGWKRDDKKWLARVWANGLSRPDKRCKSRLRQLAQFLGYYDFDPMWLPDCTPHPKAFADLEISRAVINEGHDPTKWIELVAHVTRTLRSIHRVWGRYPALMERIRKSYDSEAEMIAYWVAARYGTVTLLPIEMQAQQFVADDWQAQQQLDLRGNLVRTLLARLRESPNWLPMLKGIYKSVGEEWKPYLHYDLDSDEPIELEPDKLPEIVAHQLLIRIQEAINRPVSMDELVARFESYLGDDSQNEVAQEMLSIMSQLTTCPEWEEHCRWCYDDEETEATARIKEDWLRAKLLGFTVGQFVEAYVSTRMSERRTDKNDVKSGRVIRKPKKNE